MMTQTVYKIELQCCLVFSSCPSEAADLKVYSNQSECGNENFLLILSATLL